MSGLWHFMFWIVLPVAMFAAIRAYDEQRR
jgi:hypothetical protein